MFNPWVSIPVENVRVTVDYNYGDVRIMFKDTETIDKTIEELHRVREVVKEMEESK